jgi:hypothetical protein
MLNSSGASNKRRNGAPNEVCTSVLTRGQVIAV